MGNFNDLEYFYRGFEHGQMSERHRVLNLLHELKQDLELSGDSLDWAELFTLVDQVPRS